MSSTRILITGGASGFGKALAENYLKSGAKVLITDINDEIGHATCSELGTLGEIHFQRADTRSEADWDALHNWCEQHWGGLDILINNAGVAAAGTIDKAPLEDWQWIIDVNLLGVVLGCKTFSNAFKEKGAGQIINIASLAAIANAPLMASYNVTKAGVVSLSETLCHELTAYGINVSVVCPSFFKTNLGDTFRTTEAGMHKTLDKLLSGGKMSANDVAKYTIKQAQKNQFMILPHREGRLLWRLKRTTPGVFHRLVAKAGKKTKKQLEHKHG